MCTPNPNQAQKNRAASLVNQGVINQAQANRALKGEFNQNQIDKYLAEHKPAGAPAAGGGGGGGGGNAQPKFDPAHPFKGTGLNKDERQALVTNYAIQGNDVDVLKDAGLTKKQITAIQAKYGPFGPGAQPVDPLTTELNTLEERAEELIEPAPLGVGDPTVINLPTPGGGSVEVTPGLAPKPESAYFSGLARYARFMVRRARGVKAAIKTSPTGDKNYGKSLARPKLGAA